MWDPLFAHEIEYQLPTTLTGSLKSMVIFEFKSIPVLPFTGVVLDTEGGNSAEQTLVGEVVLRGAGAPKMKSAELLSVS